MLRRLASPLTKGLFQRQIRLYSDELTLENTKTFENLRTAFAGSASKNRYNLLELIELNFLLDVIYISRKKQM